MDLEREKGITIKAKAVRIEYTARTARRTSSTSSTRPATSTSPTRSPAPAGLRGRDPRRRRRSGHRGPDAGQRLPRHRENLTIIPVLNKIDLPSAEPETIIDELETFMASARGDHLRLRQGRDRHGDILEAIVERIPAPKGDPARPSAPDLRLPVRRLQGRHRLRADRRRGAAPRRPRPPHGQRTPRRTRWRSASSAPHAVRPAAPTGEVGYVATGLKNVREVQVGDTLTTTRRPASEPLPGYRPAKPMVFAGLYPADRRRLPAPARRAREAPAQRRLAHLRPGDRVALGFGFRCGFLGLLHMEIVQERLEREYDLDLIATAPRSSTRSRARPTGRSSVDNPALLPEPSAHRGDRGALGQRSSSSRRTATSARSWSWQPTAAATSRAWST